MIKSQKSEKLNRWRQEIVFNVHKLQKSITFLNIYEKMLFIENFFDKDSIINITTCFNSNKDTGYIAFMVGNVKSTYTVLTEKELQNYSIDAHLPTIFDAHNITNKMIGFKNNEEGLQSFIDKILVDRDLVADYKATLLDKSLPDKEDTYIKSQKI